MLRRLHGDGFAAEHIITLGWRGAPDTRIRERLQDDQVLFLTQDDDFLFGPTVSAIIVVSRVKQSRTLTGEPPAITVEAAPGAVVGNANFDASATGLLILSTTNVGVKGRQTWIDRRGSVFSTLPQPGGGGELLNVEISPDGGSVAGTRMDPATGNWDNWTVDVGSGVPTRRTRQPGIDSDPVWSHVK